LAPAADTTDSIVCSLRQRRTAESALIAG
jgi:hypothetical protein